MFPDELDQLERRTRSKFQAFVFIKPERLACRAQINLDWCTLMNLQRHLCHVG